MCVARIVSQNAEGRALPALVARATRATVTSVRGTDVRVAHLWKLSVLKLWESQNGALGLPFGLLSKQPKRVPWKNETPCLCVCVRVLFLAYVILPSVGRINLVRCIIRSLTSRPPLLNKAILGEVIFLGSPGLWPELFRTALFCVGFKFGKRDPTELQSKRSKCSF